MVTSSASLPCTKSLNPMKRIQSEVHTVIVRLGDICWWKQQHVRTLGRISYTSTNTSPPLVHPLQEAFIGKFWCLLWAFTSCQLKLIHYWEHRGLSLGTTQFRRCECCRSNILIKRRINLNLLCEGVGWGWVCACVCVFPGRVTNTRLV